MKISFSSDDRAVDFGTDDTWCVPSLRPCNDGIGGLLVRLFRGVGWNLELGSNPIPSVPKANPLPTELI
jgi:hypothetical protein